MPKGTKDECYVQIFYRCNGSEYSLAIKIPNCEATKCSLDKFLKVYADILPDKNETYKSLCGIFQN